MRVLLFVVVVCLLALSASSERVVKEKWRRQPAGWYELGRADPSTALDLLIFVKQQNLGELEAVLYAVSDPRSVYYGQHLPFEDVNSLVAPKPESILRVLGWLQHHGIDIGRQVSATPNSDIIRVLTTVQKAEELLETQYSKFQHTTGTIVTRVRDHYTLPAELAPHIDFIGPTVRFPAFPSVRRGVKKVGRTRKPQQDGVDPSFLRSLYGINNVVGTNAKNKQGIASFLEQYYNPSDLSSFFSQLFPQENGQTATVIGPNDPTNPGVEAMLDIEYIMSMGANITSEFWSTPGTQPKNPDNEPFLVWLLNVANDTSAPYVFSISYGDDEDTVDPDYAQRVNTEFQKAGVRGISLMAASGDGGVSGSQSGECTVFVPTFPADSPFITAVGGTTSSGPEVAADFSGGGFSNYFACPSYQTAAVANYFNVAQGSLPPSNVYNASGAAFPDVAAQAEDFTIVVSGFEEPVDGTSCASPTFSGVISLLNDIRFNQGKGSLGWLNPLFYQNPSVFTDITQGNNPGCNTNGFQAAVGWDPVTGLGTPNYPALAALVSKLP